MNIIKYPSKNQWDDILRRPVADYGRLHETVGAILETVKNRGDEAVKEYELKFDGVELNQLRVTEKEIADAEKQIPEELKKAILAAKGNIEKFHAAQRIDLPCVETVPGVVCWQKAVPIEKVGLYIPGGTAPLFSTVLMLAVPAKIAGCKEIVLCSPPGRDGKIHPAILFAATASGVDKIFKVGGVQAIGAMAYGTETIPKVYKIFGPGNQYVTAAKQLISLRDAAIDMPAGPSEVEVIADETANPAFVASDLLSQAEHGVDSQSILVTNSLLLAEKVSREIDVQLAALPRKEIAEKALTNSRLVVLQSLEEIIDFTNRYAPEHLIIETENYDEIAEQIVNAGSVFLGHYTPESAGDYASGTNHTLPTNGYARAYSGVNLDSFLKKITFQEISKEGILNLSKTIQVMAEHEGLHAHKNAVTLRVEGERDKVKGERFESKESTKDENIDTLPFAFHLSPCAIKYGSPEYQSMCVLRDEVLRKPIDLRLTEEETLRDKNDILLACMENGEVIACSILTKKNPDTVQLRQMAVASASQRQGLGTKILLFAEQTAREKHYSEICMHARKTAIGFYEKNGYIIIGKEFTEVGIPHFEMAKKI
jgi:histidinol dehydrogenase